MRKLYWVLTILSFQFVFSQQQPIYFVDQYIGFKSSNVQITAQHPWGMFSFGPNFHNRFKFDSLVYGFGTIHMSGAGCGQYQTGINIIPTLGEVNFKSDEVAEKFRNEISQPGYYENTFIKSNIKSKLTATERTGKAIFIYPSKGNIIVNLAKKLGNSHTHWSSIRKVSDMEIEGMMTESAFCAGESGHEIYFVIKLNKPFKTFQFSDNEKRIERPAAEHWGAKIAMALIFENQSKDSVELSVAISYTSIANARLNIETEQKNKSFEQIKNDAQNHWNEELNKIKVDGSNKNNKTIFYTALYHALLQPNIISDVNGAYPAMNSRKVQFSEFTRYSTFSLWDTYRNLHSLLTLVYPERQSDMVKSMIGMYKEGGWLPKWEHVGRETYNMVGDPAIPVIADTYIKGVKDFDTETALQAIIKHSSDTSLGNKIRPGLNSYLKYGYIPEDAKGAYYTYGSVATALEYYFDDWCGGQFALALGNETVANRLIAQSQKFHLIFDKETGFLRPKFINGTWYSPFDPTTHCGEHAADNCWAGGKGFVEGNAWQYFFMLPHGQNDLINMLGGNTKYAEKLDKFFSSDQYLPSNEPDILTPYLYNYVPGQEYKSQKLVKELISKYYSTSQKGIPGDDDLGTMSAWAVFSMMGFYPVCPGSLEYSLVIPVFDKVTISLNPKYYKGKQAIISTLNRSESNVYIKEKIKNEVKFDSYSLNHNDLVNGSNYTIKLTNKP
ncbi:MAG: GH92 family glycosyl hydrolase [Bacteroidota bacterium]|nr:GH92 family glycosyl hydrolase [Bacteroidota bacterium]